MKKTHIAIVGLGGQGVITLAKLLANYYKTVGTPVCYNEIHGLSQRGGSVQSMLSINEFECPVFLTSETDFLIGLEKMETLRFLYNSRSRPTILATNRYEVRNTVYFGLEHFATPEEIDAEISRHARELYLFDTVGFEATVDFRIKPTNVALFGSLMMFPDLGLDPEVGEQVVRQTFKSNSVLLDLNLNAYMEALNWIEEMTLTS